MANKRVSNIKTRKQSASQRLVSLWLKSFVTKEKLTYHTDGDLQFFGALLHFFKRGLMNFEKLGLYVFLKYYRQLDTAKGHLTASVRELLLAMSSSVEVAQNQIQETPVLKHMDVVPGFLKKAQSLLETSVQFFPQPTQPKIMREKQDEASQYKRDVIEAIVDVIDEEMERLQKSSRPEVHLNLDALQAVKVVMLKHLGVDLTVADDRSPIDFPLAK